MSMKNNNDTIGNRARDLLTCSAVPQPTAPPRAPNLNYSCFQQIVTSDLYLSSKSLIIGMARFSIQEDYKPLIYRTK